MGDDQKTRDELLDEVRTLRARVAASEQAAGRPEVPPVFPAGLSLRDAFDQCAGFLAVLTPDGTLVDVNRSPLETAGFCREDVIGRPFWDTGWWNLSGDVRALLRADFGAAVRGRPVRREAAYFTGAGEQRVVDRTLVPVTDRAGRVVRVIAEGRDVTDLKRAEEEIRRARDELEERVRERTAELEAERGRLEEVFRLAPSFMAVLRGPEHVFERANDRYHLLVGRRDIIGRPVREALPEVEGQGYFELLDRVYRTGEPFHGKDMPVRIRRSPDGPPEHFVLEFVYQPLRGPDGAVSGILAHGIDQTDRVRAEERVRRSERELADFFENAPIGLHWVGPDGTVLRVNRAELEMLGYTRDEYVGRSVNDIHADPEVAAAFLRRLRAGQAIHDFEARLRAKDGSIRHVLIDSNVRWEDGRFVHTRCSTRDITMRVLAERELRRSEERFARFMRHLPGYAWMKDPGGRYVYASEAVERLMGARPGALLGRTDHELLPPQTAAQVREHDQRALADDAGIRATETLTDPDGNARHYVVSKFPIRGADGGVALVGGMGVEITDRLRAEEALRASEERFTRFMRHLPGLAWIKDPRGRHVFVNAGFERAFGVAAADAAGRTNEELFPPQVAARYTDTDRVPAGGGVYTAVESDPNPGGPVRSWLVTKFPIPGPDGRPALGGGIAIDVTEQRRAEQQLREQAELLDLATDAILVHDPAGAITYWNRGAERLYGWARREALGRNADTLLGTVFPRPRAEIAAEVAGEGHWQGDLIHTRRDGSTVTVASRWCQRLGDGGGLAAVLEINTDVTELRQAAQLREQFVGRLIAAQEEERARVARELHDGVAQTLTALHLRVSALAPRAAAPEVRDELAELSRNTRGAVEEVRLLARGLRPPVLDELGLLPALTRYAEDVARAHGIRADVVASGPAGGRLPAGAETALYRIAQEALANVVRHSRATAVTLVLLRGPSFVQLLVEDDGIGWDPTSPPAAGAAYHHLGLQGMRERAELLGGSLAVESSPGGGTAVCARLPLAGGGA